MTAANHVTTGADGAPRTDPMDRTRFPIDPWRLVETSPSPDDQGLTETLFAVANGYLARSNTVAASSHAPSQLQHLQQMSVPLPNFPQVPNTIPQYAPPEPERKEALLIDL